MSSTTYHNLPREYGRSLRADRRVNLRTGEGPDVGANGNIRTVESAYIPWLTNVLSDPDMLRSLGFHEITGEWSTGDHPTEWKRAQDGRIIYITVGPGKVYRVQHCYLNSTIMSNFDADAAYAQALYAGMDNSYMFDSFGPNGEEES